MVSIAQNQQLQRSEESSFWKAQSTAEEVSVGVNTKCLDICGKALSWEVTHEPDGEVPGEDKLVELSASASI